jgi:hypothetical protein
MPLSENLPVSNFDERHPQKTDILRIYYESGWESVITLPIDR